MIRVTVHQINGEKVEFKAEQIDASLLESVRNSITSQREDDETNLPIVIRALDRSHQTGVDSLWVNPKNVAAVTTTYLPPEPPLHERSLGDTISYRLLWNHTSEEVRSDRSQHSNTRLGDDCPVCTAIHDESGRLAKERGW